MAVASGTVAAAFFSARLKHGKHRRLISSDYSYLRCKQPYTMKKLLALAFGIIALVIAPAFTSPADASGKVPLTITWYATHTIKGYSYPSKMKVYVDDQLMGESPVKDQQEKNKFTVMVPKGSHNLKCVIWAEIKGTWEERLVSNDYSFDWIYTESANFKKKNKRVIEFSVEKMGPIRKK